jgi:transposase-like protein
MDEINLPQLRRRRRTHSAEFKARIVAACQEPGVSMARIALDHGLNDNLVRRWVKAASPGTTSKSSTFVPLALPAPPTATPSPVAEDAIRIEAPRPGGTVTVTWPASQADRAMALIRELLL